MKKVKELSRKGYKIQFTPVGEEELQVIVQQIKTKERGYFSRILLYDDKKQVVPFETRLEQMLDVAVFEIEKAEKETREKISASKKQEA